MGEKGYMDIEITVGTDGGVSFVSFLNAFG